LLIAIMGDSYEKVKESEVVEAHKLRARTIIAEEALMLDSGECENNQACFPDFLEVLFTCPAMPPVSVSRPR
jgi:hypothetical protein